VKIVYIKKDDQKGFYSGPAPEYGKPLGEFTVTTAQAATDMSRQEAETVVDKLKRRGWKADVCDPAYER